MEYAGKGFFIPQLRNGSMVLNNMFSVQDDKPYQIEIPKRVWKDEDGDLCYSLDNGFYNWCSGCQNNVDHKHVLTYDERNDKFNQDIVYP